MKAWNHNRYRRAVAGAVFAALCLSVIALLAPRAEAQETLKFPLGSARLMWDSPAPTPERSAPTHHVVYCEGGTRVTVPMPANSVPMRDLVPGPGAYQCYVFAENTFGRQTEPDVPAPFAEVGYPAVGVGNVRIEVR